MELALEHVAVSAVGALQQLSRFSRAAVRPQRTPEYNDGVVDVRHQQRGPPRASRGTHPTGCRYFAQSDREELAGGGRARSKTMRADTPLSSAGSSGKRLESSEVGRVRAALARGASATSPVIFRDGFPGASPHVEGFSRILHSPRSVSREAARRAPGESLDGGVRTAPTTAGEV